MAQTDGVHEVTVELDVSAGSGLQASAQVAALVVFSRSSALDPPGRVIFAYPGATHSKEYYHLSIPGRPGYSMAEYFAGRGYVFVACDPLGMGASNHAVPPEALRRRVLVDANQAAVVEVKHRLQQGSLAPGLRAVERFTTLGIGTSLGAMLTIEQQAAHRPFDGIAVMGFSGIRTVLPSPPPGWRPPPFYGAYEGGALTKDVFYTFYWDDIPEEVIAADQALKGASPQAAVQSDSSQKGVTEPGAVAEAAKQIEVPVLIAVGERDTCPDPHAEVGAYPNSRDVALYIVPQAGHHACLAGTRELLWQRIAAWAEWVGGGRHRVGTRREC